MIKKDTHKEVVYRDGVISKKDIDGSGYSETLKLSNVNNCKIEKTTLHGGIEDCVDIVRGNDHLFEDCDFYCDNSYQAFTIKGGAHNITIRNCRFHGSPSKGYIVLGQYSDYDFCKTIPVSNMLIENCTFENPDVNQVVSWNAKDIDADFEVYRIPIIIRLAYFTFRKVYDRFKFGKLGRNKACLKMNK